MDLSATILGTSASAPTEHRGLPAVLVRAGADQLLFDCGEGTQRQLMRAGGLSDLDAIFLTHFHLDHWFGLVGIIKSFDLRERETPLHIYGPEGLAEKMKLVKALAGGVRYEIVLHNVRGNIREDAVKFEGYTVAPFLVEHRARCFGYAIIEDKQRGRVDMDKAKRLGLTGPDIGTLVRGNTVLLPSGEHGDEQVVSPSDVIGPEREGRRIVYSGDTRPTHNTELFASGADLLIHEATFTNSEAGRARQTGHSTVGEACKLATDAKARLTLLTHVSTRYTQRELQDEITGKNVLLARDFDTVTIPPKDKGEPVLSNFATGW